jgi:2-C-methyl-D-erythritol 4-phosphate cytidylyltransferase
MMAAAAIIAAGGRGDRAGGPKQFSLLRGRPLLAWCADLLAPYCPKLVIAAPAEHLDRARAALESHPGVLVVPGGDSRQESVARALEVVEAALVLVHDGARPLAGPALVERVLAALAAGARAVVPVLPIDETLKRAEQDRVLTTLDRSRLVCVQTPQGFDTAVLAEAHARAASDGFCGPDDAALVERLGHEVVTVPGERANLKVTFPEDLELAEAYAAARWS